MSAATISVQLGMITQQINRYAAIFLLLFGFVGNLLNCLVFTQRTVRSNPCSVYFLAASFANLITFLAVFVPSIVDGWNPEADLKETISALCRLVVFIVFTSRSIAAWMIAFGTVDRYLTSSSNIHRRQMSNLKNTYRCIIITCIVSFIAWLETFYCMDANMVGTPVKCYSKPNACNIYNNLGVTLIVIIIPTTVMLVFGFCTIRNIHQRRQIAPVPVNGLLISRNRRSESSLTKMLLSQVLLITLLTLPQGSLTIYTSFTSYQNKPPVQTVIEGFLFNILLLITFIPNCISFFLFTLTGSVFRQTFIDVGKKILRHF